MTKYISILRGINVGGHRKILMADLKKLYISLGFKNVLTYIQSGNVLFEYSKNTNGPELEESIEKAISMDFGFVVPVLVRTFQEWGKVISNNNYYIENTNIESLHLTLLKDLPAKESLLKIVDIDSKNDKFEIDGRHIYVFCAGKYHETKIGNNFFESKLKVQATTRNWKTVLKLSELAEQ